MKKITIISILILCLLAPGIVSAKTGISISLDRNEATVGDTVQLNVSIEGVSGGDPSIQGLQDFTVSRGGTSSQIQIINGSMTRSNQTTYILQPIKTGTFTIGPASITVSGRTYSSNTVRLSVSREPNVNAGEAGPLSLSASMSSTTAYPGQQIVYTLKLFRSVRVSDVSVQLPEVKGISFKQLGEPSEYQTTAGGSVVQVLEVRYLLSVSKPGVYRIAPSSMRMSVYDQSRRSRQDFFNDPFFETRGKPAVVSSGALSLSVRPFPQEGRPADFSGLVGKFDMKTQLDPAQVKTGDSANLTITVSGEGTVNMIPDLTFADIDGLKVYPDQPKIESDTTSGGETGSKTMKWAIVPKKPGIYELPQLSLTYFDTASGSYRTLKSPALRLNVSQGDVQSGQAPAAGSQLQTSDATQKSEVRELGRDILPIHTDAGYMRQGFNVMKNTLYASIILLIPPIAWLAVAAFVRRRNWGMKHEGVIKAKKAADVFCSSLTGHNLSANLTIEAIRIFINNRFGLSYGIITPEEAYDILPDRGGGQTDAGDLRKALSELQQSVYTGKGDMPAKTEIDLCRLIRRIDREAK